MAISTVSGGSATEDGTQSVTITITENESAPTVTLATSATSIAENAGSSLTLTATLSVATTADVTVGINKRNWNRRNRLWYDIRHYNFSWRTTGTLHLHQLMTVFMKETKLELLR